MLQEVAGMVLEYSIGRVTPAKNCFQELLTPKQSDLTKVATSCDPETRNQINQGKI